MSIPATQPGLADVRAWLKRTHNEDDPAISAALTASLSAWMAATAKELNAITDEEWLAIRLQVGHIESFRGDDAVTPEPHPFIQTIRRMHGSQSIG